MRILLFLALVIPITAQAERIFDSSFHRFEVYEMQNSEFDEKKCFIIAHPTKSDTDNYSRKTPYLMITRYQDRRKEEISIYGGFEYKLNSKVLIAVDEKKFELITNGDLAWARNRYDDASIIQLMLDSAELKVRSDAASSTFAIDEYSLKGIARAYSRMRSICR